jgi:heme/copper-type cytochrome/quinol oxidase subunit 1
MKPRDIATIGVRLVAVASIAFGIVLALSGAVMHGLLQLPLAGYSNSDLHLHDTYYVVSHVSYDLFVPSGAGILVGVLLLVLSHRLARLLVRGLDVL